MTRFGLGARPGEIGRVSHDPRGWLTAQIRPSGAPNPEGEAPDTATRMQQLLAYEGQPRPSRARPAAAPDGAMAPAEPEAPSADAQAMLDARRRQRRALVDQTGEEFLARADLAATTPDGFAERWALFWANALSVSSTNFRAATFIGQYEREAIRPHVFGRFEDMLVAAESHPAMLLYLDQVRSTGPDSPAGARRGGGLNENLAREILELHTVGADGGFTQADVTELARALTGWSIPLTANAERRLQGRRGRGPAEAASVAAPPATGGFQFRPAMHQPGARTIMGRTYAEGGFEQGEAILRDLAGRPETGRRLARRLAVHFVSDDPPPTLVDRLERAWSSSDGDLAAVARALVAAPEAWEPRPAKVKTPYEFMVSAHRALDTRPTRLRVLRLGLIQMGQPLFQPPSPEGWPDTAADWAGPDAMVKRLDWATEVGGAAGGREPEALAEGALGGRLSDRTRQFIARAESRAEGVALFLMSPEFQRR
ncbi:MAG: DUF1800 family protein [Brevundimonas sp.]